MRIHVHVQHRPTLQFSGSGVGTVAAVAAMALHFSMDLFNVFI